MKSWRKQAHPVRTRRRQKLTRLPKPQPQLPSRRERHRPRPRHARKPGRLNQFSLVTLPSPRKKPLLRGLLYPAVGIRIIGKGQELVDGAVQILVRDRQLPYLRG